MVIASALTASVVAPRGGRRCGGEQLGAGPQQRTLPARAGSAAMSRSSVATRPEIAVRVPRKTGWVVPLRMDARVTASRGSAFQVSVTPTSPGSETVREQVASVGPPRDFDGEIVQFGGGRLGDKGGFTGVCRQVQRGPSGEGVVVRRGGIRPLASRKYRVTRPRALSKSTGVSDGRGEAQDSAGRGQP